MGNAGTVVVEEVVSSPPGFKGCFEVVALLGVVERENARTERRRVVIFILESGEDSDGLLEVVLLPPVPCRCLEGEQLCGERKHNFSLSLSRCCCGLQESQHGEGKGNPNFREREKTLLEVGFHLRLL